MTELNRQYWNEHFEQNCTPWDAGAITPPIKDYVDQLTDKDAPILIPGCGNSHEAAYMLEQGFTNITLVDISPTLTERLKEKFASFIPARLNVINSDFFELEGKFDLIIEQTFLCALDPSLRKQYVEKMHRLLKPGGKLAGVLFNRTFEGGPPFSGSKEEYIDLFSKSFNIRTLEECYNSIKPRSGNEVFMIAERK